MCIFRPNFLLSFWRESMRNLNRAFIQNKKQIYERKLALFGCVVNSLSFSITTVFAQSVTITGSIRNGVNQEGIQAVSVTVKGGSQGTFTDATGNFRITVPRLPVTLVISSIGFEAKEVVVNDASAVQVSLAPASTLGQEVVVSATRTPQRILESPVSIERVSAATIRNAPAANYYDLITNLKGVDAVASSLTFRTPTTRGFSGSGNARFTQIMDGMDNQAPGLNFSVGSIVGPTELDVESMELLQGASSALYGPGGINGTLLIGTKNPFRYQGLSFQVKQGIMNIGARERSASPYYNWQLRWGQKVSERFAFKIGGEFVSATDWLADDYRNYRRTGSTGSIGAGTRETDPNFDGVNTYGDETSFNLRSVLDGLSGQIPFIGGLVSTLPSNIPVSRTGYTENQVVSPQTFNFKASGALHYKIFDNVEAILAGHWGTGNTVYTGSQRYSLRNLKMGQYKFELVGKNWFFRAFTTQENSGESYNLTVTTQLFNEAWKPTVSRNAQGRPAPQATDWAVQYAFAYINALQAGRSNLEAHNAARATADQGRPAAGSPQFNNLFNQVRNIPIPQGGLFLDRSDLYQAEAQYNLKDVVKFAEVVVGGNVRRFVLQSQGTLFMKEAEPIGINEGGAYIQVSRDVIKDVLRLTATGRYDKNQNFDGRFTPRFTALIKPAKDHNIRLSFQTAYRFPTTQQQWIDLRTAPTIFLLGSNRRLWEKYNLIDNPPVSYTNGIPGAVVNFPQVRPESVTSYEVGYKTLINRRLLIDVYGYYGIYQNFLSRRDVMQNQGRPDSLGFSIVVNAPGQVKTYGWGMSLDYQLANNFIVSGNVSSDALSDVPAGFRAFFNTPKYRAVASIGNTGFGPNKVLGFNVSWRWQDGFFYDNEFISGDVPAFHTVDAAFNIKLPKYKSRFQLGATNLLNQYFRTAVGNPSIGGLYYASFAYNVF